ncbi:MAG: hypothetical protein KJ077_38550 [Anaerolineae bacterium]|nr:hypothetical protein [Anaerolineae bacterium]
MSKLSPLQIVAVFVGLALGGTILYLAWRVINRLSLEVMTIGLGAIFTMVIVMVTALLFIIYAVVQSRLRRQELAQDDWDELKKMQMLLGSGRVNYNFKGAQFPTLPNADSMTTTWPGQLPEGEYKDTTIDLE